MNVKKHKNKRTINIHNRESRTTTTVSLLILSLHLMSGRASHCQCQQKFIRIFCSLRTCIFSPSFMKYLLKKVHNLCASDCDRDRTVIINISTVVALYRECCCLLLSLSRWWWSCYCWCLWRRKNIGKQIKCRHNSDLVAFIHCMLILQYAFLMAIQ